MSVNKVILIGNVGKDPEIRHLDSNVSVASFSLIPPRFTTTKPVKRSRKQSGTTSYAGAIWPTLPKNLSAKEARSTLRAVFAPELMKPLTGLKTAYEIYADEVRLLDQIRKQQHARASGF